jgi:hypothetical protein
MVDFTPESQSDVTGMGESLGRPVLADVRDEWEWVGPGVEEIIANDPNLTFTAYDVYDACEAKQAILWVADEGFVVATGETDPYTGKRTLLLWLAWAKERGHNLVAKYQDFFVMAAREAGFAKLETRSSVPALQDYLPSLGWDVETVVYTRRL